MRRAPTERGMALLAVLVVMVLLETTLLVAASRIHDSNRHLIRERERLTATHLAESGLAMASARLRAEPGFRGELDDALEGGTVHTRVTTTGAQLQVTSKGATRTGYTIEIVLQLRRADGQWRIASRARRTIVE